MISPLFTPKPKEKPPEARESLFRGLLTQWRALRQKRKERRQEQQSFDWDLED